MSGLIGIFGGTFDPVHNAHLRAALDVVEAGGLDELRLIPCHVPPHRESPALDAATRLHLLRLATRGDPRLVVDDRELRRAGPSYTVDTLRELRREFPAGRFCLLLGTDSFHGLPAWSRWQELATHAHLVVMQRPAPQRPLPAALNAWLRGRVAESWEVLHSAPVGQVLFQPVAQLAISATELRQRLARGGSIRYLVPDPVWEHIERQGIYRRQG